MNTVVIYLLSLLLLIVLDLFLIQTTAAQPKFNPTLQDSSLNNLVLPAGYHTGPPGELGAVKKAGKGKQAVILIPGWGFGAEVFDNFIAANYKNYKMYAVTPAGFGGTAAPPEPAAGIKYSDHTWTRSIVDGILKLIEKERLKKPVIVAHFVTGTQAALDLALSHPEKIGKIVIMSGMPHRYFSMAAKDMVTGPETALTVEQRSMIADRLADSWFKTVTKKTWDKGNHQPSEYSADPATGQKLFDISAKIPVPVMVRYLQEFSAYDISSHYSEIRVPILFLLPSFSASYFRETRETLFGPRTNEWMTYYFISCWDSVRASKNLLFEFKTISNTHLFLWYDDPRETYQAIADFVKRK
jgi:pimeloyl-ACP methyl ester carboxylesterase